MIFGRLDNFVCCFKFLLLHFQIASCPRLCCSSPSSLPIKRSIKWYSLPSLALFDLFFLFSCQGCYWFCHSCLTKLSQHKTWLLICVNIFIVCFLLVLAFSDTVSCIHAIYLPILLILFYICNYRWWNKYDTHFILVTYEIAYLPLVCGYMPR